VWTCIDDLPDKMGQLIMNFLPCLPQGRKAGGSMKILVAEDDFISRNLLIKLLQKIGYQVTAAENGAEAWRHFQDEEYEMIITD